jgi:hypothetical protein
MYRRRTRSITKLVLVAMAAAGCGGTPVPIDGDEARNGPRAIETKRVANTSLVGVEIHATGRDPQELFEDWRTLGIDTVFASEELTSSAGFRALARKNGTDLYVNFPVFFAPEELASDPDLWAVTADGKRAKADWLEFACPSRTKFRERRLEQARDLVRRLRPEGLSIDFIRHFVYWEMVGPERDPSTLPETCYCVHCLQTFATSLGLPLGSIPPQPQRAAAWIRANAAERWLRFRIDTITSMAEEIAEAVRAIDPTIRINLHIVPWRRDDYDGAIMRIAGQDLPALSEVADYLSPMTYSFMLHRPPEWIAAVVEDFEWVANCPIVPSIQVAPAYRDDKVFSAAEFEAALRAALEPPSAGVIFWSWDHIEADPERAEIIRRVLRRGMVEGS